MKSKQIFSFTVYVTVLSALLGSKVWALETAQVLPKGIFRARVVSVFTGNIDEKFNEDSQLQSFSASLNRSVTINDFVNKDPRLGQLVQALDTLQPGAGDNLLNTNIYSGVNTQVQTFLPCLEYGITNDISLGVRIPIVHRIVSGDFQVATVNNAQYYGMMIGQLSPALSSGIYNLQTQQLNTAYFKNLIFTQNGYYPQGFDRTDMGDTEFGAKYEFYRSRLIDVSGLWGWRAPTGTTASLNNPYDTGSGDGSWATAVQFFQEVKAASYLSFGGMQKLQYNLPDTRSRAVPKDASDALPSVLPSSGQVQDVTRQQSPDFESELASIFKLDHGSISLWGAYQFMNRGPANFYGPGDLYYQGLSAGTEVQSHNGELGLGYSTIPAFRAKKFSVPLEIQALYNTVLTGRNVPLVSYVRMDMIVYF